MRRRTATAVVLLVSSGAVLTGCGEDGILDALPTELPTELPTGLPTALPTALPTGLPGGDGDGDSAGGDGGGESGGEPGGDQDAGSAAGPADTPEPEPEQEPQPEPEPEPAPEETATPTDPVDQTADDATGFPWWGWVAIIATLVAIVALLATRRRGSTDRQLAAQADGQVAWVRSTVDDPLVRWRGQQLGLAVEQRDTDSETARRWTLVDERLTAATTDLLTLESGGARDDVRQSAGMLRQAAEGYRASLDALATSVATGDQARIAQASQALDADTALLDQARQRFRRAAGL